MYFKKSSLAHGLCLFVGLLSVSLSHATDSYASSYGGHSQSNQYWFSDSSAGNHQHQGNRYQSYHNQPNHLQNDHAFGGHHYSHYHWQGFGFQKRRHQVRHPHNYYCPHTGPTNNAPVAQAQQLTTQQNQTLETTLSASDEDGDPLHYRIWKQPRHGTLSGQIPNLTYTPDAGFVGMDRLVFKASDGQLFDKAVIRIQVTPTDSGGNNESTCELYPITLPESLLSGSLAGQAFNHIRLGSGSGNYGWLTWTGNNSANTLANSLLVPGNSTNYINPDNSNDHQIDINDWVQGVPGVKNSRHVRDNLDLLIGQDIIIPVWAIKRGQGSHRDYQVQQFGIIEITGYRLGGKGWISFIFKGYTDCNGQAPVADDSAYQTAQNTAVTTTALASDADGDALVYSIVETTQFGTLSGTAPDYLYTPNADFQGVDYFTFTVNDGSADSNVGTVTITVLSVNSAPVANDQNLQTDEDQAVTVLLVGTDEDNDPLSFSVVSQPQNGTLSGDAPDLTYMPNADFNGSDSFTFLVNDGQLDSNVATTSITVNALNDAPVTDDLSLATDEDQAIAILLSANDPEGDSIVFAIVSQPQNGTLSGDAPNLTYTPNTDFNGVDSFTYRANDGQLDSSVATINITINPLNDAPFAIDAGFVTDEDQAVATPVSASDSDGDALTYSIASQPQNGILSGDVPNLIYTPNADFNGADSFEFIVNDGQLDSNIATVSISVNPLNDAPVADDQSLVTEEDQALSITVAGSDVDGDSITYTIAAQPQNGTLSGDVPNLTYTPNADFNGADSFEFIVNDGQLDSNVATVSITVNPLNDAPVADDQSLATDEDQAVSVIVVGSDVDGDSITYTIATQPQNGTLSGDAPNLTYTPNADFNGADSFEFIVNDGQLDSSVATVSITVNPLNDAPVAINANFSTNEDQAVATPLAASDLDGDVLSYSIVSQPQNGVLSGDAPNLTYTPNAGFSGEDSFSYTANDAELTSNIAMISIEVIAVNKAPDIVSTPVNFVVAGQQWNYTLVAVDPDGDAVSYAATQLPNGAQFDVNTGQATWSTQDLQPGNYVFEFSAMDDNGLASTQSVTVEILSATRATSHEGKDFWLPVTINHTIDNSVYHLFFVSRQDATVTLDMPALGRTETIQLLANEVSTYTIPAADIQQIDGFAVNQLLVDHALHATSDKPMTVYVLNQLQFSSDAYLALPVSALGKRYLSGHYQVLPAGIDIRTADPITTLVATQDNTQVNIKGSMDVFHADNQSVQLGQTLTLNLNAGDVYNLPARGSAKADLTGTLIEADKPIAVLGQNPCAFVPANVASCDHLVEQLPAIDSLGTDYVTAPLYGAARVGAADRVGDIFRIVAAFDDTDVYINGVLRRRMNQQEFYEYNTLEPQKIHASRPVLLLQYSTGRQFGVGRLIENNKTDPFMVVVPPSEQYLLDYTINTPSLDIERNFVNIIIPTAAISSAVFDGVPVDAADFTAIEGTDLSYSQREITAGTHRLSAEQPLGVYVYGYDAAESYGYLGGMAISLPDSVQDLSLQLLPAQPSTGHICVSAQVADNNGRPVHGARLEFSVGGTHSALGYVFSDPMGEARYCYQGYQVGDDTVSVKVGELEATQAASWSAPLDNVAPVISSLPELLLVASQSYSYQVMAVDPNGDALTYTLQQSPSGMTLSTDGLLEWAVPAVVAEQTVVVEVADNLGLAVEQRFALSEFIAFNTAPEFDSVTPNANAIVGVPYVYDQQYIDNPSFERKFTIDTTDVDGDAVYLSLVDAPTEATISRETALFAKLDCSGCLSFLNWTPQQVGMASFDLSMRDSRGGLAQSKQFSVDVLPNAAPEILSTAPSKALVGNRYTYVLDINNDVPISAQSNLDDLQVVFEQKPNTMNSRLVAQNFFQRRYVAEWTPQLADVGLQTVKLHVADRVNSSSTQEFTIEVVDNNTAPSIISTFLGQAEVSIEYQYTVLANDLENDPLSYELLLAPAGMSIDANSGLVTWTPQEQDTQGQHTVWIAVDDGNGGVSIQKGSILVQAFTNRAPTFIPAYRPDSARQGLEYTHLAAATDREGDPISYHLDVAPAGSNIDSTGLIRWTPSSTGTFNFRVRATDDKNASSTEFWQVTVVDSNAVFAASLEFSPSNVVALGETVTITVNTVNAASSPQVSAIVDGVAATVNGLLQLQVTPQTVGKTPVMVTVSDGVDTVILNANVLVPDPADTAAPVVEIQSPTGLLEVTDVTAIVGTAQDDNLAEVLLAYKRADQANDEFVEIYRGGDEFDQQTIGFFDPSLLLNGTYHILLQATDSNGLTTGKAVSVQVEGNLKVGVFSFTLEDVNIPLSGIPIRVTRTYDSRRRNESLDFGKGWSIDYQNVIIQENMEPSQSWRTEQTNATFLVNGGTVNLSAQCIISDVAKTVTITLPNDEVEVFNVYAQPSNDSQVSFSDPDCYLVPDNFFTLKFRADADTDSTLESTDGESLFLSDDAGGNLTDIGGTEPTPINRYRLTTRAGYVYNLNQNFGIVDITDPNGNTLTYSNDGIQHSDGVGVTFERDTQGRITKITDPAGNEHKYLYQNTDNLVFSFDPLNKRSTYKYEDANHPSLLTDWNDPLNRNLVKNLYDDEGRLVAQLDNEGNRTEFNHDLAGRVSIVTDRRGFSTQLFYDARGNVINQVDALGNASSRTYDADDNQLSQTNELGDSSSATYNDTDDQLTQTDELGNVTSFAYNSLGQETIITDARGNTFNNNYDAVGNLLSIEDPQGNLATNVIGAKGLVANVTDVLGNNTSFTYDAKGNKLTETDAEGHVMSFTYDDNNNVLSETRTRLVNGLPVNETTNYEYDSRDRVIKTTDALGNESTMEYDAAGHEVASVDALGRRTQMSYDAYGRLLITTYPDGSTSRKTYDPEGNLKTDTDRLGRVTSYDYDALGRLITTTFADNSSTQTEYDAAGRVSANIDARGNRTQYVYDAAGRRTQVTDALGNIMQYAYDADGNMTAMTDANGNTTSYVYNALDQKTQTTFASASTMLDGLDALSRKTSMTDQAGVVTNYEYDKLGRLIKVIDALNQETTYTYDSAGNKLTQTDAEGRTTTWEYDALGRVTKRILPLGQQETMVYDAIGNLTQHTDFNGQVRTHSYDVNNRLTNTVYANGLSETYSYDLEGNRTRAVKTENAVATTTNYTFDSLNRLASETQFAGTANAVTLSYQYDAQGNRITLTETKGAATKITRYTFDALNRLKTVTDANGNVTTYGYDAVGNRSTIDYANGNSVDYVYDELNRLTNLSHKDSANLQVASYDYTLHPTGRRIRISEQAGRISDYVYDDLYRMTSEVITDAVNGNHSSSYQYDKVGNRTYETVNGVQTQYTIDDNDRLLQTGGTTFTYDANGNTLTETLDGNTTAYTYNARNELTSTTKAGNTTSYQYNIDGIRIGQSTASDAILYTVDANRDYAQVLAEHVNGAETIAYTYGDDLVSEQMSTDTYYYHYDGLGSTRALSNSAGIFTDTYDYEAFGEVLNQSGTTENKYLFAGEQFDAGQDRYYLRARYYDQNVGRFDKMDTWMGNNSDPVTLHKYLYANADPANMIDPTGNFSLASVSAVNNIRAILTNVSVESGMGILDAALGDGSSPGGGALLGLAVLGGPAAFKILGKLSRKFRRACNSFDGETLVATEDGLTSISQIMIGDKVWAYNEETGEKTLQEVVHLIAGEGNKELVDITLANGEVITATTGHPFYVNGEWLDAGELTDVSQLFDLNGEVLAIADIKHYNKVGKVYNLTVDDDHTYYVGDSRVLSHNISACDPPDAKLWSHVFRGKRKPGRRLHGVHHAEAGVSPKGVAIEKIPGTELSGFYVAKIFRLGSGGGKRAKVGGRPPGSSTMFPDNWSRRKVRDVVNAAYYKALGRNDSFVELSEILGPKYIGIRLKFESSGGKLTSVYPVLPSQR
ncbi:MAG: Ig-like domain-containing protein [Arenicella sp.]